MLTRKGYTLVITEKPDAAKRIALALNRTGKVKREIEKGVPYYIARRDKEIVVVPSLGHLYTVCQKRKRWSDYPVLDLQWVPRYVAERGAQHTRRWINTISRLAGGAEEFVDACDYDLEGSLIGYCILRYACNEKHTVSKRMKFSTLTREELERSYCELLPHLDFSLIEAGRTRHEIDWLYGINLSRALTISARDWSGRFTTLSTGRVQGPALNFLVSRERTVRTFVPTPYWQVKAQVKIDSSSFTAIYEKMKIKTREEADYIIKTCLGRKGEVRRVILKRARLMPPSPFDLGTLQREAWSLLGFSPRKTADIAQRLYVGALISYPRTSSQKLPPQIGYRRVLGKLSNIPRYEELVHLILARPALCPAEGPREDPAHPSIYPTGERPEQLDDRQNKVFDLIVKRFMSTFGDLAVKERIKIQIEVGKHCFQLTGSQILAEGWLTFYRPYERLQETRLPSLAEGQIVDIERVVLETSFQKPPSRYNPGSILKKLEEAGIGTKATRADIIHTLYKRKYIHGQRMIPTHLGFAVTRIMEKYCPSVLSEDMTRELEGRVSRIAAGREEREGVVADAAEMLKPIMETMKREKRPIGEELSSAIRQAWLVERSVGACPTCRTGSLVILYSKKTRKRFIGCTGYLDSRCHTSFAIPQKGSVKPLMKECEACGWPMIQVAVRGKRPWPLCFNPNCLWRRSKE